MKILLDENIPHGFRGLLPGHDVYTVQWMGWGSIKNGELLKMADREFDVLITVDRGIRYQNNFSDKRIAVITMICTFNKMSVLKHYAPFVLMKLNHIVPGLVINLTRDDLW